MPSRVIWFSVASFLANDQTWVHDQCWLFPFLNIKGIKEIIFVQVLHFFKQKFLTIRELWPTFTRRNGVVVEACLTQILCVTAFHPKMRNSGTRNLEFIIGPAHNALWSRSQFNVCFFFLLFSAAVWLNPPTVMIKRKRDVLKSSP